MTRPLRATFSMFLSGTTLSCGSSPSGPSGISDAAATSCDGPGLVFPSPGPGPELRQIIPSAIVINVGISVAVNICFFRDTERPGIGAATQWTMADTNIASVSPPIGATAIVTALSFGTTTLTAIINGAPVVAAVRVCDQRGCL